MRLFAALMLLVCATTANAVELISVNVERSSGTYMMHSKVRFNVVLEQLYDTMTDWDLSTQYSSVVVESRNTGPDELGRPGFYSKTRACLAFFCKSVERAGYVELELNQIIRAVADPASSDFHVSTELWQFVRDGEGTILSYTLEMRPKFWVPPIVGPYLIKRKLRTDGIDALSRIEVVALAQAANNE